MRNTKSLGSKSLIAAVALCWGVFSATAASANSILINPEPGAANQTNRTVTSVSGDIWGLYAPGWPATTPQVDFFNATGFVLGSGSSPDAQAALMTNIVNDVVPGAVFTGSTNSSAGLSFTFTSQFFAVKDDGWIAFFLNGNYSADGNNTNDAITVNLDGTSAISHTAPLSGGPFITTFNAVPNPVVGAGLPALVGACGFLIALARRRRMRTA